MARRVLYVVFILPVLFSIIFGSAVMADILQNPDRELNLWQFEGDHLDDHESIEILGIEKQYSLSQPITFDIKVSDPNFSCGDLYVTIHSDDQTITQSGFFQQCFSLDDPILPTDAKFSDTVDVPGIYTVTVEMTDQHQRNSLIISKEFTVK